MIYKDQQTYTKMSENYYGNNNENYESYKFNDFSEESKKILCDIYNRLINSSIYEINDLAHEVNNNNININNLLRYIKNKIIY